MISVLLLTCVPSPTTLSMHRPVYLGHQQALRHILFLLQTALPLSLCTYYSLILSTWNIPPSFKFWVNANCLWIRVSRSLLFKWSYSSESLWLAPSHISSDWGRCQPRSLRLSAVPVMLLWLATWIHRRAILIPRVLFHTNFLLASPMILLPVFIICR